MSDCGCLQMHRLEGNRADEYSRAHLIKVAGDPRTWHILYRCPTTGTYWVKTYPHSHLQGAGPPVLRRVTLEDARAEFGDVV
jgi:hypothetical protein